MRDGQGTDKTPTWTEALGLIDALTQTHSPSSTFTETNRYGKAFTGHRYTFELAEASELPYDGFCVSETMIGVQRAGYDVSSGKANEVTYRLAYSYSRLSAGLVLAKTVIAREIRLVVPIKMDQYRPLTAEQVITDIRSYMTQVD